MKVTQGCRLTATRVSRGRNARSVCSSARWTAVRIHDKRHVYVDCCGGRPAAAEDRQFARAYADHSATPAPPGLGRGRNRAPLRLCRVLDPSWHLAGLAYREGVLICLFLTPIDACCTGPPMGRE